MKLGFSPPGILTPLKFHEGISGLKTAILQYHSAFVPSPFKFAVSVWLKLKRNKKEITANT